MRDPEFKLTVAKINSWQAKLSEELAKNSISVSEIDRHLRGKDKETYIENLKKWCDNPATTTQQKMELSDYLLTAKNHPLAKERTSSFFRSGMTTHMAMAQGILARDLTPAQQKNLKFTEKKDVFLNRKNARNAYHSVLKEDRTEKTQKLDIGMQPVRKKSF